MGGKVNLERLMNVIEPLRAGEQDGILEDAIEKGLLTDPKVIDDIYKYDTKKAAEAYERIGDFEKAADLYVSINDQELAAKAFERAGRLEDAFNQYDKARMWRCDHTTDPEEMVLKDLQRSDEATEDAARVLIEIGDYPRAIEFIKDFLDKPGLAMRTAEKWANEMHEAKRYDSEAEAWQEYIDIGLWTVHSFREDKGSGTFARMAAEKLWERGDKERAYKTLENIEFYDVLAELAEKDKDYERAIKAHRRAGGQEHFKRMSELSLKLEKPEDAVKFLRMGEMFDEGIALAREHELHEEIAKTIDSAIRYHREERNWGEVARYHREAESIEEDKIDDPFDLRERVNPEDAEIYKTVAKILG